VNYVVNEGVTYLLMELKGKPKCMR
jgi:hypothetical protein